MPNPLFVVKTPWRKQAVGDPPELDYSAVDDWVCPVEAIIEGKPDRFVLDVQLDCFEINPNDPGAADAVKRKALVVAAALNIALANREWKETALPLLLPQFDQFEQLYQ